MKSLKPNQIPELIAALGPTRTVLGVCAGCLEDLEYGAPGGIGAWENPDLYRRIVYFLCQRCHTEMEKSKKRQKRMAQKVEKNLTSLGVLEGIERAEVQA